MNIKKFVFVFLLMLLAGANQKVLGQSWTIRTNLAYDAMLIPSLGAEYALSDRHSISLMGTYNRFNSGDKKWKNWSVQPELRLWREAPFMGWFMGINVIGGGFNINNVRIGGLGDKHRQGGCDWGVRKQRLRDRKEDCRAIHNGDTVATRSTQNPIRYRWRLQCCQNHGRPDTGRNTEPWRI